MDRSKITLTDEEWEMVEGWYDSAAGESASGIYCPEREHITTQEAFDKYYAEMLKTKALLDKLGFEYHYMDSYTLRRHNLIAPEEDKDEESDARPD